MLELQGAARGLLDDPLTLRVRGLGGDAGPLAWRARLRDDDGRVWRAAADRPERLAAAFTAGGSAPPVAALRSLRPVAIDVRVEAPDGRAAARTLRRALVGPGVRVRRWRGLLPGGEATLHRPAGAPTATVLLDATGGEPDATVALLSAPLLASRGVLVLTVARGGGGRGPRPEPSALLAAAADRLAAAVPGAPPPDAIEVVAPLLAPGIPARRPGDPAAWDQLLARLGAAPRLAARERGHGADRQLVSRRT